LALGSSKGSTLVLPTLTMVPSDSSTVAMRLLIATSKPITWPASPSLSVTGATTFWPTVTLVFDMVYLLIDSENSLFALGCGLFPHHMFIVPQMSIQNKYSFRKRYYNIERYL